MSENANSDDLQSLRFVMTQGCMNRRVPREWRTAWEDYISDAAVGKVFLSALVSALDGVEYHSMLSGIELRKNTLIELMSSALNVVVDDAQYPAMSAGDIQAWSFLMALIYPVSELQELNAEELRTAVSAAMLRPGEVAWSDVMNAVRSDIDPSLFGLLTHTRGITFDAGVERRGPQTWIEDIHWDGSRWVANSESDSKYRV
jgi:hypothetical protein